MTDGKGVYVSNTSIFDYTNSCLPKIASDHGLICAGLQRVPEEASCIQATQYEPQALCGCLRESYHYPSSSRPSESTEPSMHLTELNHQCLLHLFSFLDKDSRKSVSQTCLRLREVFLDPCLWTLLHFSSLSQLRENNFILGSSLRYLTISWHSSRVLQVCNIEDWLKTSFQKDICSKHENLVSDFLKHVCNKCPNLLHLSLAGCAHISDQDILSVLRSCPRLRCLHLENCVRITDSALEGVVTYGASLEEVRVDFCRNISQSGLQQVQERWPEVRLRAERSAGMIPDSRPEERETIRRTLQKILVFS